MSMPFGLGFGQLAAVFFTDTHYSLHCICTLAMQQQFLHFQCNAPSIPHRPGWGKRRGANMRMGSKDSCQRCIFATWWQAAALALTWCSHDPQNPPQHLQCHCIWCQGLIAQTCLPALTQPCRKLQKHSTQA